MRSVTTAQAKDQFAEILDAAISGETIVVTDNGGKPVAEITPAEPDLATREAAKREMIEQLRKRPAMNLPRITRDELYEDSYP